MKPGSIVAIVTPMHDTTNQIDYEALSQLIEWHIEQGTDALVILGTTAESPCINQQERHDIIQHCVKQANKRIPIIAGTGTNCTATTIEYTQQAKELGADAALLITPYYNKPTQQGLYLHFKAINNAVSIPQILYINPGRAACDLLPETAIQLSKLENIIGIKDASGDLSRIKEIKANAGKEFLLWTGCDENTDAFIEQGGDGTISVTANVAPAAIKELTQLALAGQHDKAKALQKKLMPLHDAMFCEPNPIPIKWALYHMGKINRGIRLPLTELSDTLKPQVENTIRTHY